MTEEEYRFAKERIQKRKEDRARKVRTSRMILAAFLILVLIGGTAAVAIPHLKKANAGKTPAASTEAMPESESSQDPASQEESQESASVPEEPESETSEEESVEESSSEPEPVICKANVATIGDLMVHLEQLQKAYNWETESFDFSPSYQMITEELSAPDYTIANLETTFGGLDTWSAERFQGYTGYPCFNSPDVLATNLKDAGIDFVGTANNHSMDSTAEGIQRTLEVVHAAGLDSTGTFSELDAPRYIVEDINGIRIALMAYTYGANGFSMPEDEEGYFNSFVDYHQDKIDKMYEDVKATAAQPDVDLVAVMLHMGEEYVYTPTAKTQEVVDELFKSGCDIVYASHPHVLEPFEFRTIENEDGTTRQGFVIYSLGNFISAQHYTSDRPYFMDVGVILDMDLEKIDDQKPTITGVKLMPTYCQWTDSTIRVIPVEKALDSYLYGDNFYDASSYHYERLLASQDFFQTTFWPEQYEYTIEDGYYVVDMDNVWEPAKDSEEE